MRRLVVAGGETSGAVVRALGVRALRIGAQIDPGVPWTLTVPGEPRIALALKSGNFGAVDFFVKALGMLEGAASMSAKRSCAKRSAAWTHRSTSAASRTARPATSARRCDDGWLLTPTGSNLGRLDPARLSKLDWQGQLLAGDPPSKEAFLHLAMYQERPSNGAVVHLHSTHSVAVSVLAEVDPHDVLPPLTAYYVMRIGSLPLVPYYAPGDMQLAQAVRGSRRSTTRCCSPTTARWWAARRWPRRPTRSRSSKRRRSCTCWCAGRSCAARRGRDRRHPAALPDQVESGARVPGRFVIAQIKHETNTFSPIATPYEAFGHGNGPIYGADAKRALAGTNSPFAAFLDVAAREGAEAVTPIAAESWPSNRASRATFERLLHPLEEAVRAGCDAVMLDLHGAMVVEGADDAEGEILARVRRIAPDLPIAVAFDYHTNLSPEIVANATVITGYKTYPHVDMYETGRVAGEILARTLRGELEPVMAWGWLPLVSSIMRHAPEDGPSGDIVGLAREAECGPRAGGHAAAGVCACRHALHRMLRRGRRRRAPRGKAAAQGVCDAMLTIAWERRAEYVFRPRAACRIGAAARTLGARAAGPILLIDHCDNCGSGGAQDVMLVVEEILAQELDDVAIAPIRDPGGGGADGRGRHRRECQARARRQDRHAVDRPQGAAGRPLAAGVRNITDGEIVFTGPMYTGLKTHSGAPRCSTPGARRSSSPSATTSRSTW